MRRLGSRGQSQDRPQDAPAAAAPGGQPGRDRREQLPGPGVGHGGPPPRSVAVLPPGTWPPGSRDPRSLMRAHGILSHIIDCLLAPGQGQEALSVATRARGEFPKSSEAALQLGYALVATGADEAAVGQFLAAMDLSRHSEDLGPSHHGLVELAANNVGRLSRFEDPRTGFLAAVGAAQARSRLRRYADDPQRGRRCVGALATLASLSPVHRAVLTLRYLRGYTRRRLRG